MTPALAPSAPQPASTGSKAARTATGARAPSANDSPACASANAPNAGKGSTTATGPPGPATGPPAAFASVLGDHVARTAPAEGQKKTKGNPAGGQTADDQNASDPAAPGAPVLVADVQAVAALPSAAATASAVGAGPAGDASSGAAQSAAGAPGAAILPEPAQPTSGSAAAPDPLAGLTGATSGQAPSSQDPSASPGNPGQTPTPLPNSGQTHAPLANPGQTPAPPADEGQTPTPGAAAPSTAPTTAHLGLPTATEASAPVTATAAPATPPAAPAAAAPSPAPVAAHAAPADAPAAAPQPQPGSASAQITPLTAPQPEQPATAAAPADAGGVRYGVGLEHAIETVRMTVDMAARQGVSQARIQLSPASLGGIRIQLSQTADGLVARVVADHGAAAQTLQQGSAELRRSLEASGIPLLRLDIETSGQRGASAQDSYRADGGGQHDEAPAGEQGEGSEPSHATVELTNGESVNVLA